MSSKRKIVLMVVGVFILIVGVLMAGKGVSKNEETSAYLDQVNFNTIEFASLLDKTIDDSWWISGDEYMLDSFTVGISAEHEIRNIALEVSRESSQGIARYELLYNQESNYLRLEEYEDAVGTSAGRVKAADFLSQFDALKINMVLPSGQFDYYTIELIASDVGLAQNVSREYYVWDGITLEKGSAGGSDPRGEVLMVYGEPVGKNDQPYFYLMTRK